MNKLIELYKTNLYFNIALVFIMFWGWILIGLLPTTEIIQFGVFLSALSTLLLSIARIITKLNTETFKLE
jgi:hypothetical protein